MPDDHLRTPRYTRYAASRLRLGARGRASGSASGWRGLTATLLVAVLGFGMSWWWGVASLVLAVGGGAIIVFGAVAARWLAVVTVVCVAAVVGAAVGWTQKTIAVVETRNPETVAKVRKELVPELPGEATNILVLGSDHRYQFGGDAGRSDTLMLLRLDPKTKSISMLSVPRDLYVEIPGYGSYRINEAYSHGRPAPLDQDLQVAHRAADQPLHGSRLRRLQQHRRCSRRRLSRHRSQVLQPDELRAGRRSTCPPDTRSSRATTRSSSPASATSTATSCAWSGSRLLIRELQRQSFRWDNWRRIPRLVEIVTRNTTSDLSKLKDWLSLARLILEVDTSQVYTAQLVGSTTHGR